MGIANELPLLTDKIDVMATKAARIPDVLFIPLQAYHQTETFIEDFLEGLTKKEVQALNDQWNGFADLYKSCKKRNIKQFAEEFAIDLCLHNPFAYLVKIETAQSINSVEFVNGEVKGFSYSWSSTSWVWRFARDMDHAVDQAIEIAKANILKHGKRLEEAKESQA